MATALVPMSPATPAKAALNRAGSSKPLANLPASSMLIIRPPVIAIGLIVRFFLLFPASRGLLPDIGYSRPSEFLHITSLDEVTDTSLIMLM